MRSTRRTDAFDDLFGRLWPSTVRLASRLVGSVDAEDVAIEAFARALERWDRISAHPQLEAWVLRVATNIALDRLRHRKRQYWSLAVAEPVTAEEATALQLTLREALKRLPRRQGEVLVLRYLAQLSEPEVAVALGVSLGSVKTHARRGIATLRRRLGDDREELFDVG